MRTHTEMMDALAIDVSREYEALLAKKKELASRLDAIEARMRDCLAVERAVQTIASFLEMKETGDDV